MEHTVNARILPLPLLAVALLVLLWLPRTAAQPRTTDAHEVRVYLPLAAPAAVLSDLPRPPTAAATTEPPATVTAAITKTPLPPTATDEPTATPTETSAPTEEPATGTIRGRYTENGEPLPAGYGADGFPQIELQRCAGGGCETVARTISQEGGLLAFENPPALEPGQAYQVVWANEPGLSYDGFLHRWWSRRITSFGDGSDVDLGAMEVGNLVLTDICHDCGQSLPITFKWRTRPPREEVYRWSLFRACGDYAERPNAYRTESLGHRGQYTLNAPPRGFRLDEKYCWFIQIEDSQRGTGWSYYDWRVTFLSVH